VSQFSANCTAAVPRNFSMECTLTSNSSPESCLPKGNWDVQTVVNNLLNYMFQKMLQYQKFIVKFLWNFEIHNFLTMVCTKIIFPGVKLTPPHPSDLARSFPVPRGRTPTAGGGVTLIWSSTDSTHPTVPSPPQANTLRFGTLRKSSKL
jgi:hypothetical protein